VSGRAPSFMSFMAERGRQTRPVGAATSPPRVHCVGAGRDRWRLGYIASYGWMERERLAPMAASSSPAHASPEMLPATQPAGGTEVPPRGAPSCGGMAFPRRRAQRIPAATPRGSIQLARGGVRGTRARATESASLSAAGLGAATTSADGSVSRLSSSDGEYSLRVGPKKGRF